MLVAKDQPITVVLDQYEIGPHREARRQLAKLIFVAGIG